MKITRKDQMRQAAEAFREYARLIETGEALAFACSIYTAETTKTAFAGSGTILMGLIGMLQTAAIASHINGSGEEDDGEHTYH